MKKTIFNHGWTVKPGVEDPFGAIFGGGDVGKAVTLPHDAMIEEERCPEAVSGCQYGFYPAKSYTYLKTFHAPESWAEGTNILEFEGVMRRASVFLNGEFLAHHNNGYTSFYVDLGPYLRYGQENTLKVLAINEEKSSRWYPGSGIYRDVWLWQGGNTHFLPAKQHITTESVEEDYAVLLLEGQIHHSSRQAKKLRLEARILNAGGAAVASAVNWLPISGESNACWHSRITVDDPALWSVEAPNLYTCTLKLYDGEQLLDEQVESFGIRTLKLDARKGLRINGQSVKLRGACIHHDNGVIGAATYYDAELFRLKKLKEAGFNALRSAHNPMSKAMLRACDELGMLVMDEFTDMWNEPKNAGDWSHDFGGSWEKELQRLVDKDYNHPCVILYSTGNELPEIGRVSGADQNRKIAEAIRKLDPSRYSTVGISGILAVVDDLPLFAAAMEQQAQPMETTGGSEEMNSVMGSAEQQMLDAFSVSELLTNRLEAVESAVDVVGYNYMTARHELEHRLHPDRVVVGSETYPPEIPRLWDIVERNPHVIGDFTWTGWDYIGEAGIGIHHYDSDNRAQGWYPDRLAYVGDIDLDGNRRPMSYLRQSAYGLRKAPYIAVERVDKYGKQYDRNSWKYADCIASWTFPGYEGKPARVRVIADCEEVELFLNGTSLGRKAVGESEAYTAIYELTYEPGKLEAVGYCNGISIGNVSLVTADTVSGLRVSADKEALYADGQSLAFLTAELTDDAGNLNCWEEKEVTVSVEGEAELLGFGSAIPSGGGSYQDHTWKTYDGRVMAVIRSTTETGNIRVTFSAPGCEDVVVMLSSINR